MPTDAEPPETTHGHEHLRPAWQAVLATIVVLVLISRARATSGSSAPASLGIAFVPDR